MAIPRAGQSLNTLFILVVLVLALSEISSAATTASAAPPQSTLSVADASSKSTECGFKGDENVYGLGIRLGVYLQWLTSALAYNFVPEESTTLRGVNTGFTLSNFAGLLYITINPTNSRPEGLYAIEVWIVISFCLGGAFSGASTGGDDDVPPTFANYRASTIGGLISTALSAAVIFYTIWFLYIGMDTMLAPPCSRTAFFFAKVDLYHWFRTFLKVVFTISAAMTGLFLVALLFVITPVLLFKLGPKQFLKSLLGIRRPSEDETEGTEPHRSDKLELQSIAFSFSPLAILILGTELLIRWNHIEDVSAIMGTGQLLPVIVAGGGLVRVFWKFLVNLVSGKYTFSPQGMAFSA
ncbi:MAG: hypothetical protein M1832_003380 [Thelocarpon impressellum]|nr:MAG: hypothetical protein M1832_003380 [Thelocarpon impressellum]